MFGAGRKPFAEKKYPMTLYFENKIPLKFGSRELLKDALYSFAYGYGDGDLECELQKGETEPFKNIGIFVPQSIPEQRSNYFAPEIQPPKQNVPLSKYKSYEIELKDCRNGDEIKTVMSRIRSDSDLTRQEKQLLEMVYNKTVSEKGIYFDND